jgi:hypothetical protein
MSDVNKGGARHPRLQLRLAAVTGLGLLAAAMVVSAAWYRANYHTWPGQAASDRVHWCGRNYQAASATGTGWAQISSRAGGPIRLVGNYLPLGPAEPMYAVITPASQRNAASPPLPCSMVVYLRKARNQYVTYSLLGGP